MTEQTATGDQGGILASSAIMAAGTVVSRFTGFFRSTLLAAALGASLHADLFTIANTVPNMLYILLAGGVFNAVLVPQLVRAMKNDADGGSAYVDRVVTLATLFLGAVTTLLVVAAPWVMAVLLSNKFADPSLAAQRDSVIDLARYCLPQVFFYGMFVLVGQVLNARGRFGPMMWAPIANNVISVAVLVVYLFAFGPAAGAARGAFTPAQETLLGLGSTLGIAAQFAILVPYLRAAGIRITPRFDFRGTGLGSTLRLGIWTVLFVIVNQAAYVVVVRLASGGTASAADGTGITIYSSVFLVVMVPHSVVTVSLATAILPRLSRQAADGDMTSFGRTLTDTARSAMVVAVPFAALLPVVAHEIAQVIWGHGATLHTYDRFEPTLSLFGVGLVFFTIHYLSLRGYYALELNRLVFFVQCAIAAVNIAAAIVLVHQVSADDTSPMLVLAYTAAYAVGACLSFGLLSRRLHVLELGPLAGFLARLLLATAVSTGIAWAASWPIDRGFDHLPGHGTWPWALVEGVVVTLVDVVVFVGAARVLRIGEVTAVIGTLTGRLRRG